MPPSGACERASVFHASNVSSGDMWRLRKSWEPVVQSQDVPGLFFFQFTKTGCEIKNVSCIFPGHALQSAGAKCNSIRIQILAKQ